MVTQAQIARKLGISRQLVTLALRGYPQVSAESRERILATARKMGYRPNPHARALKLARTGIVGLWIPDQISSHYNHVARQLNLIAHQANHELIVTEIRGRQSQELLSNVPVDGIFAVDSPEAAKASAQSPEAVGKPIVSLGASTCDLVDSVAVNLQLGTRLVMEHLLECGYQRIAHATFSHSPTIDAGRLEGYLQAMRSAGLRTELIQYELSPQQRANARTAIIRYVEQNGPPQAIFCHSDDAALGIYRGLCDLCLRVPQDVALVGCDGIEDTEYLECPLTTLVQPVAEMCAAAWEFFSDRLEDPDHPRQHKTLLPSLAIRNSTSPVNRKPER
jgi:DNA-binding LacI/PurR family transcriptional regulator